MADTLNYAGKLRGRIIGNNKYDYYLSDDRIAELFGLLKTVNGQSLIGPGDIVARQGIYYGKTEESMTSPANYMEATFMLATSAQSIRLAGDAGTGSNYNDRNIPNIGRILIDNVKIDHKYYAVDASSNRTSISAAKNIQYPTQYTMHNIKYYYNDEYGNELYGIEKIFPYAFDNCDKLIDIKLPSSITEIGKYAFNKCKYLNTVKVPNGVQKIDQYAFQECTSLTNIELPDSVTTLGQSVFKNCSNLKSFRVPQYLTTVGAGIFNNCTSLEKITIPAGASSRCANIFSSCTAIHDVYCDGLDFPLDLRGSKAAANTWDLDYTLSHIQPGGALLFSNTIGSAILALDSFDLDQYNASVDYFYSQPKIAYCDKTIDCQVTEHSDDITIQSDTGVEDELYLIEDASMSCIFDLKKDGEKVDITAIDYEFYNIFPDADPNEYGMLFMYDLVNPASNQFTKLVKLSIGAILLELHEDNTGASMSSLSEWPDDYAVGVIFYAQTQYGVYSYKTSWTISPVLNN